MLVELCCQDIRSAIAAHNLGFERIELNAGLELGGLSPYTEQIEEIKKSCPIKIISLIRSRAGGFFYEEDEISFMLKQAENALRAGSHGVAFGALNRDFTINERASERFRELCFKYKAEFVFHRAFDCARDLREIEKLIELETNRVLTSGQRKNVELGSENLRLLMNEYGSKITILAGGGVNTENFERIAKKTGVLELHGSFSKQIQSEENNEVSYGTFMTADYEKLKKIAEIKNRM